MKEKLIIFAIVLLFILCIAGCKEEEPERTGKQGISSSGVSGEQPDQSAGRADGADDSNGAGTVFTCRGAGAEDTSRRSSAGRAGSEDSETTQGHGNVSGGEV